MPAQQNTAKLRMSTEKHWRRLGRHTRGNMRTAIWREYARDLLPLEMKGKTAPLSCDTLVVLVGHSVEPLLQSVWAYEPKKLLLILSERYGKDLSGKEFAGIIRTELLPELPQDRSVSNKDIDQEIVQAEPAAVFQALVDRVRNREGVVIDITGAKKSMVTGAFLYAAYAKVPISYVDFDDADYSTQYHRPYGYASHIQSFENPYERFALRDWEQVQQLYDAYHFREARKLLEGILPVMVELDKSRDKPKDESMYERAVRRLIAALHCYELWDSGDFFAAAEGATAMRKEGIGFSPPTAVTVLADIWPHASADIVAQAATELRDGHEEMIWDGSLPERSIFCQTEQLLVYAKDELARIQRLIDYNEDYRSALLRSASLNEVLLKARFANLWIQGELTRGSGPLPSFGLLVGEATAGSMLKVLVGEWWELRLGYAQDKRTAVLPPGLKLRSFWDECDLDLDTVIKLRNDTIHTYLSVPKNVAQAATEVARRNLDDYVTHWVVDSTPEVTMQMSLTWRALCKLCGADAFLPPNLLE